MHVVQGTVDLAIAILQKTLHIILLLLGSRRFLPHVDYLVLLNVRHDAADVVIDVLGSCQAARLIILTCRPDDLLAERLLLLLRIEFAYVFAARLKASSVLLSNHELRRRPRLLLFL